MTSRETSAARETPIAITLRSQFAFRISGTPLARFGEILVTGEILLFRRAYVRIKRMLNEFVAQNRVSVARNGVQSSIRRDVCSLIPPSPLPPLLRPALSSLFLFLDTLIRSTIVRLFLSSRSLSHVREFARLLSH